jgi:hypothetical protein
MGMLGYETGWTVMDGGGCSVADAGAAGWGMGSAASCGAMSDMAREKGKADGAKADI